MASDDISLNNDSGCPINLSESLIPDTNNLVIATNTIDTKNRHLILENCEELPQIAKLHLKNYPYQAPQNIADRYFWYEGTFDPFGPHHLEVFLKTWNFGYERAILAVVFQNPYKPQSLPYEDRYEMASRAIKDAGLEVTNDPKLPGVCIFKTEMEFHFHRMNVLFDRNSDILIGPDNFQNAMKNNILWVHPNQIRENPAASDYFGFRSLYDNVPGFKEKILVYDQLHDIHSTDIRNGKAPSLASVQEYCSQKALYKEAPAPKRQAAIVIKDTSEIAANEVILRQELVSATCQSLNKFGLLDLQGNVAHTVNKIMARMDMGELMSILNELMSAGEITSLNGHSFNIDRNSLFSRQEFNFNPPVAQLTRFRTAMFEALIGKNIQVSGGDNILDVITNRQKILFVGNHSGWADLGLLPLALAKSRCNVLNDGLVYLVNDDIFTAPFVRSVFGKSVGRVLPSQENPITSYERLLKRFGKNGTDAVAIFPEVDRLQKGVSIFDYNFVEALNKKYSDKVSNDLVIIPWAQEGGDAIVNGNGSCFTEEFPVSVSFGKPVALQTILQLNEQYGPAVVSHLLGIMVSRMLPIENRGTYGEYSEHYLEDSNCKRSQKIIADLQTANSLINEI